MVKVEGPASAGPPAEVWSMIEAEPFEPGLQMALDEVLLRRVAAGQRPPTLRLWRWTVPALVIGSHQSVANEVDLEAAAELGFVLVRRMSGGGTMIAEPGRTITYSLYLSGQVLAGLSFAESYRRLDAWAVDTLRELGVEAAYQPLNDIVSTRGKIGGAAQARRRGAVLHHTTIAYSMDVALVRRLIRLGRAQLSATGIRSAEKEVTPLDWFTSASLSEVEGRLLEAFARLHRTVAGVISADELNEARQLAREKYLTREWTYRIP